MESLKHTKEIVIDINIPCWNCGEIIVCPFDLFDGRAEYVYCLSCKAGWEFYYNNKVLLLEPLSYED